MSDKVVDKQPCIHFPRGLHPDVHGSGTPLYIRDPVSNPTFDIIAYDQAVNQLDSETMALVEYSDSDSDSEAPTQPTPAPAPAPAAGPNSKKPFQKVVDRANPGKIRVNLPQTKREDPVTTNDEPPAKRAKTGGGGGGLFAGFGSMLPAPKNAAKRPSALSGGSSSSRPVFQLKTSAEAGFSRESPTTDGNEGGSGFVLPSPKAAPQPSIPDTMKPEEEVKLVGKPMMFRPLSVARNKKKPAKKIPAPAPAPAPSAAGASAEAAKEAGPAPPPKKISLFSLDSEPEPQTEPSAASSTGAYEPLFQTEPVANPYDPYGGEAAPYANHPVPTTAPTSNQESLDTIANDLNLSAAERRELFGRGGMTGAQGPAATRVINFNTDREYQHNEDLRAAGQEQTHQPVRSIAPGKHNLRQLVNAVQNNRDALEESFAKGKSNRKDASSRYGW
ncbi:hypothetical protein ACHAQA_001276 [Verticillium albo-atrum]